ncbi:uncharacterized protein LOC126837342 [Adelges cooleyi]|uniref:uncharacterized protein LOC126837342 n=1 Tax=Adelges cooleyi TaxID=133065 RepID=UPI00217F28FF|nr:uncharacterized protein LOC126837342 [Adelges cooleyi]
MNFKYLIIFLYTFDHISTEMEKSIIENNGLLGRLYQQINFDYHEVTRSTIEKYFSDQKIRNIWKIRDWEAEKIIDSVWSIHMNEFEFTALVKSVFTAEQLNYIYDEAILHCEEIMKFFGFYVYTKRKIDKQAIKEYLFDHSHGLTQKEIEKLTEHLPLGNMTKETFIKHMIFGNHFLQYPNETLMDHCRC